MKLSRKLGALVLAGPLIVVLDQWTKWEIMERFRLGESVDVIEGFFSLSYIRNTGAAFGFMANVEPAIRIPFFTAVPLIALGAIAYVFRKVAPDDLRMGSALAMVVGGALGNLIDRLRFGYVIDFLDFHWRGNYHFPAFNVADSAICVGVGLLMLDLLAAEEPAAPKLEETKADAPTSV